MLIHRCLAGNQDIDICSIFKLWETLLSLEERHDTQAPYIPVQILLWPNIYLEPLVGKLNVFLVNYSCCNSSWLVFWMGCLLFSLSEWECSGFISSGLVTLSSFWAYFTLNNEWWGRLICTATLLTRWVWHADLRCNSVWSSETAVWQRETVLPNQLNVSWSHIPHPITNVSLLHWTRLPNWRGKSGTSCLA